MIVKIQRPLFPADGPFLFYNEDRTYMAQVPSSPELLALMGDRFKMYVKAEFNDSGKIMATVPCEDQSW